MSGSSATNSVPSDILSATVGFCAATGAASVKASSTPATGVHARIARTVMRSPRGTFRTAATG